MKSAVATLAFVVVLGASTIAFGDEAVDAALAKMADATGDDYVAARKALTGSPGALQTLDALLDAHGRWTDKTFRKLAMATIARAHLARPDVVAKVNHLRGLDAAQYQQRRRADPECGRELTALGRDAVGPLLELYLKTFDSYPFSKANRPENAVEAAAAASKERVALRVGMVIALSRSGHPAAFFVCKELARSDAEDEGVRSQAIEALGEIGTREAFAELTRIHADRERFNDTLRLATVRAAAGVPSASALEFLTARLSSESALERKTAVVAIGNFGSAWAWEARGEDAGTDGDRLRRDAAAALVSALERLAEECSEEIADALGTIAHESSVELLRETATRSPLALKALERVKTSVERNKR